MMVTQSDLIQAVGAAISNQNQILPIISNLYLLGSASAILYPSEEFLRLCRLRKERRGRCHRERVLTNLSGKVVTANWGVNGIEKLTNLNHIHIEKVSTHVGKSVYLFELHSSGTPG